MYNWFLYYSSLLHGIVLAADKNLGIRLGPVGGLGQATFVHELLEVLLCVPVPGSIGGEEEVHFLEGALVGLGVERPNHGERDGVRDTENVKGLLADGLEHDGAEEGQPSVTDRPSNDTECVTLCADGEWEDLSWVQPWDGEPGSAEYRGEDEDHRGAGSTESRCSAGVSVGGGLESDGGETASEEHGNTLGDGSPVEGLAATDAIQSEDADESCKLDCC